MKLNKLFKTAIAHGIAADPRGKAKIDKILKKEKEGQSKLKGLEKELADEERTWNPFADSRIYNGTGEEDIKTLAVGIDIETQDILLVDRLREKGKKIDAIFAHHPEGRGLADLDKVMEMQIEVYGGVGVPENLSDGLMRPRMDKIRRAIHADNLFRSETTATLLGIPMFNCHTPTDNLVWQFITKTICKKEYDDLGQIIKALTAIPEYKYYAKKGNPPIIANGSKSGRPGKIVATEFTGGTNGPEEILEAQAHAGVGTILSMHVTEKTLEKAKECHVNMIQCSHMASDAIGINLMLDKLSKEEKKLSVVDISGFVRVKRK